MRNRRDAMRVVTVINGWVNVHVVSHNTGTFLFTTTDWNENKVTVTTNNKCVNSQLLLSKPGCMAVFCF